MKGTSFQPLTFKKNLFIFWLSFLVGISSIVTGFVLLQTTINSKKNIFLNQTKIAKIDVSALTKEEAISKIRSVEGKRKTFQITIKAESGDQNNSNNQVSFASEKINFERPVEKSVEEAFVKNHSGFSLRNPLKLISLLTTEKNYPIKNSFDEEKIENLVHSLSKLVDKPGNNPFALLKKSNNLKTLTINPGEKGLKINQKMLRQKISAQLANKKDFASLEITVSPQTTHFKLTQKQMEEARERAALFVGQNIWLKNKASKDIKIRLVDTQLIPLLDFPQGYNQQEISKLINEIDQDTARDPENAEFEYEKKSKTKLEISVFKPHKTGLKLKKDEFKKILIKTLEKIEIKEKNSQEKNQGSGWSKPEDITLEIPFEITEPDIPLSKTNDLGINELIGFGDSEYDHSIPNRIFNVAHATQRISGTIVAPGEEFSFNKALGEVSKRTGYKSAYVISGGKTVLGDGGGVCQVSTTVFRAALNAGLPITKRKQHAYRVSYYELNQKPGIDATVYSGDVDLRFINDTPGYILIHGETDSKELYMKIEIYGTSDGRTTQITDHKTWDKRGAPPAVYYPTTDIPPGTIRQIDWSVSGIKASFKNVTRDKSGAIIREEQFYSNYAPWSAKFLQGI